MRYVYWVITVFAALCFVGQLAVLGYALINGVWSVVPRSLAFLLLLGVCVRMGSDWITQA